ncbi:MAG TPA: FtsX-like permease family protein [Steroidobacteraceae bacterium]|jgi:putative ABC transport system permease protein|nr:FtsX-like permease family protein [Steroidobacteraceae bacterium]
MNAAGSLKLWRLLLLAQLREQPVRFFVTVLALALGVALGSSVYLVNTSALNEFGLATKRLVGEADIVIRGQHDGFSEQLYVDLARNGAVSAASPVLEIEAALPKHEDTLKILGLDPLRAAMLQPALIGDIGEGMFQLFDPQTIYLSQSAAQALKLRRGDQLELTVGSASKTLRVLGILAPATYPQPLGLMDIASAQWLFDAVGRLNRIDLRLAPGTDVESFRRELGKRLPAGVLAIAPQVERDRAVSVTRAYRVNLNMLALVALFTGAFLVFSTQSLSVLRRRRSLALLRAIGVTQRQLRAALIGEGLTLGVVGALIGVALGMLVAAAILKFLTADLGNGQMRAVGASLRAAPLQLLTFFAIGVIAAAVGAWVPARNAAREPPARALKGGNSDYRSAAGMSWRAGIALLILGSVLAWLPPIGGLPVFGYTAIGALLLGAVLLVPTVTLKTLGFAPQSRRIVLDTAVAQLRENVGLSALSLAAIIVSFSLMVAMAIMIHSFRVSFDHWLGKLLPADLQLREPFGSDSAYWSPTDQLRLAQVPGVARVEFRRTRRLLLDPKRAPVTLIARGADDVQTAAELPLLQSAPAARGGQPAWVSEAFQDLYGYKVGDSLELPLAGSTRQFVIAGIWRDYARLSGSIVISLPAYRAATGDQRANEGSLWLRPNADATATERLLRARIANGDALEITTTTALHERSLQIFDRAFAVTYALEFIAVIIGLAGVSFAAGSTALARRAEFGMLRHVGMLRRQIIVMLADEGILTSVFGVIYGLALGGALSLVLVYVVNRQSFNWSIDLAIPAWQLAVLSFALIGAAAITAVWSGRAALSQDAVRAVREDW